MNAPGDIHLWLITQKPVSFSASFVKQLAKAFDYVYLSKFPSLCTIYSFVFSQVWMISKYHVLSWV